MPDLPAEPSLQQLRHQARDLQRAVRSGAPDALAEVAERHPAGRARMMRPPLRSASAPRSSSRPALTVWAAAHGQPGSVELLAGLGFDVNAKGRSDAPAPDPWQTALHVAAMEGNLDLARSLLTLGADPGIRDQRFNSTPLGWAHYFGQHQLVELLEPLSAAEEPQNP